MAVLVNQMPPTQTIFPTPSKPRLPTPLIRHASAPASPELNIDFTSAGENHKIKSLHSFASPQRSSTKPRPKHGLLSELSLTQSLTSRLRHDRDSWRSLAERQKPDLAAAERVVQQQTSTICYLEDENVKLRNRNAEEFSMGQQIFTRFQELISKHDNLADQLNDALRTIIRLKKSDRSKEKVQQRNLRLKATLQRYTSQVPLPQQIHEDSIATLQEALALANERIGELEAKGEALLEVLERRHDNSGSGDEREMEEKTVEEDLLEL
ncbi:hypothetical protein BKA66DRAFT_253734 [Pyrenochaeta sp. MPI-SDFR-AT-0127]|nr:hypothetical protein BKA66DRAFT_253734 [Pyrenochaeta sp. MPI-SDFR-AT-0127]